MKTLIASLRRSARRALPIAVLACLAPSASAQWVAKNSGLPVGQKFTDIKVAGSALVVSTYGAGIFRSTDNGETWSPVSGLAGNGLIVARLHAIDTGVFLVAGTGQGIVRSTDSGQTWLTVNGGIPANNFAFSFASTPGVVYAGLVTVGGPTNPSGLVGAGIYRSTDGIVNWTAVNTGLPPNSDGTYPGIGEMAASGSVVVAGTSGSGLFRSTDGGTSWADITPPPSGLGSFAEKFTGDVIFVGTNLYLGTGADIGGNGSFYRSGNNGTAWTKLVAGSISLSGQLDAIQCFAARDSTLFIGGGLGVQTYGLSSGARRDISQGLPQSTLQPAQLTQINAIAATSQFVFVATDYGGVYRRPFSEVAVAGSGTPPTIVGNPSSRSVASGATVILGLTVTGDAPFSYVWRKDGTPIAGATNATHTLNNIQPADAGTYSVVVTNAAGSATSANATITITGPGGGGTGPAPAIAAQPLGVAALAGQRLALNVGASGTGLTYQWFKRGPGAPAAIAGATGALLVLANVGAADAGSYFCAITNSAGSTASADALVTVAASAANPSRLANLSIRSQAGTGAETLIVGATIGGGTGVKPVLLRGIGPALTAFGVSGALSDPVMTVFAGDTPIATNDNWGGDAQVAGVAATVGAFALAPASSRDAALYNAAIPPGGYSVQLTGNGGATGVALAELYDATPAASFTNATPRLINVSARTHVGTGGDILIAGISIAGDTAKTVLIRGVGPTLSVFGVTGALSDPKLELFSGATKLFENDDWGGSTAVAGAAASVGAFALNAASKDAAILLTLPPGSYTAQISGNGGATGVALVEVYELGN